MKFRLTRSLTTLLASLTILLLVCLNANAQGRIGQNWFNNGASPNFSRTLTILGGWNFPSAGTADQFSGQINSSPVPTALPISLITELDDSGYAVSFALGRRYSNTLRTEIEAAFRSNDINTTFNGDDSSEVRDGSVNATSLMKNFIFDFGNGTRFTPYAGAGIGITYLDIGSGEETGAFTFDEDQTLFSYQAIGGVATRLNSAADFIVEYRFLGTSGVEFREFGQELSYNTSNLFLGVKLEY